MTYERAAEQSSHVSGIRDPDPRVIEQKGLALEAAQILDDVRRALERDMGDARIAALRLVRLLAAGPRPRPVNARGGLAPWQKRKVDRYMGDHLEQPIRVEELADQVSLSVSHFCRAFKESFAETPHSYIMRLRVELAQRLMLTTEAPLSQIARDCGLSDQAHLSKLFRRRLGETPSTWRRLNLTETPSHGRKRPSPAPQARG